MDGEEAVMDLGIGGDSGGSDVSVEPSGDEILSTGTEEVSTQPEQQDEQPQEQPQDGRQVAAAIKNHLAELKRTNPQLEKQLRADIYAGKAAREFGSIPDIRTKLETLDLHGGAEGIAQMAEEVQAARTLDQGFERGDPKLLDGWAKDFPDGFKKLVVPAFDKLATLDPQYYEQAGSAISTKFLTQYGVFDGLGQMKEAIVGGKMEDVQRIYNDLVGKVFGPMQNLASKARTAPDTAKDSEYQEREEKVAKAERDVFLKGVNSEATPIITRNMNKVISSILGTKKLTAEQNNKLRKDIHAEIAQMVNNPQTNAGYINSWKQLVAKNDQQRLVPLITRMWESKTLDAVKKVMRESGFSTNGTQPKPAQTTRQAAPTGVQVASNEPSADSVDWRRSTKANYALGGPVWLLNGKQVKWGR